MGKRIFLRMAQIDHIGYSIINNLNKFAQRFVCYFRSILDGSWNALNIINKDVIITQRNRSDIELKEMFSEGIFAKCHFLVFEFSEYQMSRDM